MQLEVLLLKNADIADIKFTFFIQNKKERCDYRESVIRGSGIKRFLLLV